jgi:hypothetical protein
MAIVLKRSKFEDRPTGIDGAGALGSQVAHMCRYGRVFNCVQPPAPVTKALTKAPRFSPDSARLRGQAELAPFL